MDVTELFDGIEITLLFAVSGLYKLLFYCTEYICRHYHLQIFVFVYRSWVRSYRQGRSWVSNLCLRCWLVVTGTKVIKNHPNLHISFSGCRVFKNKYMFVVISGIVLGKLALFYSFTGLNLTLSHFTCLFFTVWAI